MPVRASAAQSMTSSAAQCPVARMSAWFVARVVAGMPWTASAASPLETPGTMRKGNTRLCEGQSLLAATPEDERIAAFEPQDALALAGQCQPGAAMSRCKRRRLAAALSGVFESGRPPAPRPECGH